MKIDIFWEQESVSLNLPDKGFTPVDLLEELGPKGRDMILEVLICNYREELKRMLKDVEKFEKAH